jgi:hypothetical protein
VHGIEQGSRSRTTTKDEYEQNVRQCPSMIISSGAFISRVFDLAYAARIGGFALLLVAVVNLGKAASQSNTPDARR